MPSPKPAAASGRKSKAGTVLRDTDSDLGGVGAIAQKLKRKYDETDPLAEFMGDNASPAKARVSREADLPVASKKAASTSRYVTCRGV